MMHSLKDVFAQPADAAVRAPAVAGRFYPADAAELAALVQRLLLAAPARPTAPAIVRGLIAPHAGYACSGEVAAAAYRSLLSSRTSQALAAAEPAQTPPTVYLLGPAHWRPVDGVGLPRATAFATPLGAVPVAVQKVTHLLQLGAHYKLNEAAHLPEHCLEVQIPFLQAALGTFNIVPMLFDDGADPEQTAADLIALLQGHPADLVVVSSDLSHYHPYQESIILDNGLLKAIATGNLRAADAGEACGLLPILCLMRIAEHFGWTPALRAYANSGDTCGSKREVVGYGAVAYSDRVQ